MAYTYITDRYHKTSRVEIPDDDPVVTQKRKLAYAMRMRDREAQKQWQLDHSKGYCPKCHCLLPLTGRCDNCE